MNYQEFMARNNFNFAEILGMAHGTTISDPPEHFDSRLPAPPFLMVDRVLKIDSDGRKGKIIAEQDIRMDAWYFQCHFIGDPVQPGCLCVDAVWQLLGFYCLWRGALGSGRALGCGEIVFNGQIRPFNKCVRYEIDVRRYSELKDSGSAVVTGDGKIYVDDELIAVVSQAKAGIFKNIAYKDYPVRSKNSLGGIMER
ncbi:MAG: bifunctional 3-hydroxydecanoyl-ACP dehydratase/trans-2-decenoyl-ACP isomerase [Deltaproteobacteria bacterium HGW-Deltaproteobacteria-10]|nr:MAG: bifunctional 3-hydroxydecanoyl-ACP dehydratase/trans-2-decenoyl-ACP isomerase [Deltaproteobacteria bacterium HGW-Deltaproteobacteria-10]